MRRLESMISIKSSEWRGRAALAALLLSAAFAAPLPAQASAALQIMPVLIEFPPGAEVATVNIVNQDSKPVPVQVRVFRWSQSEGVEKLEPTEDVVASPPIGAIAPRATLNVRIVRVSKEPASAEELYRLVIDQLPQRDSAGRAIVSILLRQVLPVFFNPPDREPPNVTWSIGAVDGGYVLRARNSGGRRLRIAKIVISGAGAPIKLGGGLLGYALAHSEMSWTLPARRGSFGSGKRVTLRGDSDLGALDATAIVSAR